MEQEQQLNSQPDGKGWVDHRLSLVLRTVLSQWLKKIFTAW